MRVQEFKQCMDISRNLSHLLPYYFDFRNQIGSSFTEATDKTEINGKYRHSLDWII